MNNQFYMYFDKQVFVADKLLNEPYILDLTDKDIKNGYASKEHMVTLFTISEMFGADVSVFLNKEPNFNKEDYSRIISVPFEVRTGEAIIYADMEEVERIPITNGKYDLYFAIKGKDVNPDTEDNEYEIYFVKNEHTTFKSILRDEW